VSSRAYSNFNDSLKSDKTRSAYNSGLRDFMQFSKINEHDQILLSSNLQETIVDYIKDLRRRNLAYWTIRVNLASIRHFCVMNDITLNWPKIYKFIGEARTKTRDRIYSKDEIRQILEKCDARKRVMFLLLLTGMRIGALPDLKLRNIKKWTEYGVYQITIYEGTNAEYFTFCTPETTAAIDSYLDFRKRSGETLTPNAPLLREQFNQKNAANPRQMSLGGLYTVMEPVIIEAGIRVPSNDQHKRHEVMLFHGFRKYVNTQMIRAGVKPVIKEMLLGHGTGLEDSYYRPTEEEILREYLKAIGVLTISDEKQLKLEVERLKTETAEIETIKKNFLDMRVESDKKDVLIKNLGEQLGVLFQAITIPDGEERRKKLADAAKQWITNGLYSARK